MASDGKDDTPAQPQPERVEDADPVWLSGQVVEITNVPGRPDLKGRIGTLACSSDDPDNLAISVHLPHLRMEQVRVAAEHVHQLTDEPTLSVMWLYARRLNTGNHGSAMEVTADAYAVDNDDDSCLREIPCTLSELHDFVTRMQFKPLATPVCQRLGLSLRAYAFPFPSEQAGCGRDNVLASRLCTSAQSSASSGSDARVVVGTAFFVRMAGESGELVDFKHGEALRALFFLNDLERVAAEAPAGVLSDVVWDTMVQCYPYYEEGCRLTETGFFGLNGSITRLEDGTLQKDPADMQPVAGHIE